jgi:hypothetical protein
VGAIAGAAVGCLLAGLAIGVLVSLLTFRSRRRRTSQFIAQPIQVHANPKAFDIAVPVAEQHRYPIERFLLDATPDKEIASELIALGDLIEQHAESHYHINSIEADSAALRQTLVSLQVGNRRGERTEAIVSLALNPRTRLIAIRHVLSRVLFSSIDVRVHRSPSMLPVPVVDFLQSIPEVEQGADNAEATLAALSQWRSLSAFLLHPHRSQRSPLVPLERSISSQTQACVAELNQFLAPFIHADPTSRMQQNNHLQAVIMECTKFGYSIFSHPCEWQFDFDTKGAHGGLNRVVLCPGLNKLSSQDGTRYDAPRSVVAPRATLV